MDKVEQVEIRIPVDLCEQPHIDNLILAIVHCGYAAYYNKEERRVCFTGWSDELVTEIGNEN